jgi:uncharacterized membrane protein YgaE (UPF0421/DUF939 family)
MVREYDSGFEAKMNEWFSYFRQLVSAEEYEKGKQQYEEYKKKLSKVQTRYEIEEVKNIITMHENVINSLKKKKDSIDQDMVRENAAHNRTLKEIDQLQLSVKMDGVRIIIGQIQIELFFTILIKETQGVFLLQILSLL